MNVDTAIRLIQHEHSFYNDDRARVEIVPEWQKVIDYIRGLNTFEESQIVKLLAENGRLKKDAEIGRAACKALELFGVAGLGYSDDKSDNICYPALDANEADDPCNDPNCPWFKFCRLRAERSGE